jgi:5-formyltetrahydrofolate cyclo-ligase
MGGLADALLARGVRVAIPALVGDVPELREGVPGPGLGPGPLGALQPPPEAPAIAPDAVDLFVVPGLLFDRSGRRLGRGGGHFDRLLARARTDALRVGVCPSEALVDELPEDPWDVRMHRVVTEREVLWTGEPVPGAGGAR